jgi:hypothetical protein
MESLVKEYAEKNICIGSVKSLNCVEQHISRKKKREDGAGMIETIEIIKNLNRSKK